MRDISKKISLEDKIILSFGFFSTMPIIQVAGLSLYTIFAIFLGLYLAFKIIKERINPFQKGSNIWFMFIFFSFSVSAIICLISDMQEYWKKEQIISLLWQGIFLIFLVFFNRKESRRTAEYFFQGIYFAAIFQVAWGYCQFFIYRIWQISINDVFFSELLQFSNEATHWKYNGDIALSGFCWHVGNMNPLIVLGYVFSNNIYLKFLFVVFSFICNSRTAILGVLICIIFESIFAFKKLETKSKKKIVLTAGIIMTTVIILKGNSIAEKIYLISESIMSGNIDTSALTHLGYWVMIPELFERVDIINLLFGFGLECSGYPFSNWYSQYVGSSWIIECDYINQLWNTGIVGVVMIYGWWLHLYRVSSKVSSKYSIFIFALLVQGITYNVMFKWMWLVLFAIYSIARYSTKENIETGSVKI